MVSNDGAGGSDITVAPAVTNVSWKSAASAAFTTASAWSGGVAPTSTSNATIAAPGAAYTVSIASGTNVAVGSLSLNSGNATLSLSGTLSAASYLDALNGSLLLNASSAVATTNTFWQNSALIKGAGALTVTGTALFNGPGVETGTGTTTLKGASTIDGPSNGVGLSLDAARVLLNKGALTWTNGEIYLGYNPSGSVGGSSINNAAGATFAIQSDQSVVNNLGTTSFVNAGTLTKSVTGGVTTIGTVFTNTGAVSVQTGTLDLANGGSSAASAFTMASGAALEFGGGTFNLASGTDAGAGVMELTAGTLALGANAVTLGAFNQSGGVLTGSAALTLTSAATISGGYESGASTLAQAGVNFANANLSLDGGRNLQLGGASVATGNSGSLNLNGANPNNGVSAAGVGTLTVLANAVFNDATSGGFSISAVNQGGTDTGVTASVVNKGTFEESGGGSATVGVTFANSGAVSVVNGSLTLAGAFQQHRHGVGAVRDVGLDRRRLLEQRRFHRGERRRPRHRRRDVHACRGQHLLGAWSTSSTRRRFSLARRRTPRSPHSSRMRAWFPARGSSR